jgi:hypothetical protein
MSPTTAVLKEKNMVCRILLIFGLLLLCAPGLGGPRRQARINGKASQQQPSRTQLEALLSREFGASTRLSSAEPGGIVIGDFNGDSNPDLAVMVDVEKARDELLQHGIKLIDTDPYSKTNGSTLQMAKFEAHNCAGLAIVHGSANGWTEPAVRFLTYDCFSSTKLFPRRRRVLAAGGARAAAPHLIGDGLVLELENGGKSLIYWTGRTYKGYGLASGD